MRTRLCDGFFPQETEAEAEVELSEGEGDEAALGILYKADFLTVKGDSPFWRHGECNFKKAWLILSPKRSDDFVQLYPNFGDIDHGTEKLSEGGCGRRAGPREREEATERGHRWNRGSPAIRSSHTSSSSLQVKGT